MGGFTARVELMKSGTFIGICFSLLQLLFTLGWAAYALYLPTMSSAAGIPMASVTVILMLDQATFAIMSTVMGAFADKIAARGHHLGGLIALFAGVSCIAFVALPYLADVGPSMQPWFIAALTVWVVASSVLRAAPAKLLGQFAARPDLPFLAVLVTLGYGIAGAATPYLAIGLRDIDARLPFIFSSVALMVTVLALSAGEQAGLLRPPPRQVVITTPMPGAAMLVVLIMSITALATGFEIHTNLMAKILFQQVAEPATAEWLRQTFWIGFNIVMFPASLLVKRYGGLVVIGMSGLVGAVALAGTEVTGDPNMLTLAHAIFGAAWGCVVSAGIATALILGKGIAEGMLVGLVSAALAAATFIRILISASGAFALPVEGSLLRWLPLLCWTVAGAATLMLAIARYRQMQAKPSAAPAAVSIRSR